MKTLFNQNLQIVKFVQIPLQYQIRSVRRELETSIDGGGTKTWRVFHIGVAVLRGREGAKISTIIERMRCRDGEDDYVRIGNFMISRNKHRLKRRAEGILVMGLKDQPENMLPLLVDKSYTAGQRQNGKQQSHVNKTQNAPNSKKRKNNLQGNVAKKQNTNSVNPRNNQTQRDRNATPKGFIAGLSLKPLYPRDTTIPRTESWCSFHHHCDVSYLKIRIFTITALCAFKKLTFGSTSNQLNS